MSNDNTNTEWTMKVAKCPWTEETVREVGFVVHTLALSGGERILDLGCGYGRHALALAELGYDVVGVDITPEYIYEAKARAASRRLDATFICSNILDIHFDTEFDVVLNLCDGAIGYCESDDDNEMMFEIIANALVPDGNHLLQVLNRNHAEKYFPRRDWDYGKEAISMVEFRWDPDRLRMLYSEKLAYWGRVLDRCENVLNTSVRLYSISELRDILNSVGMRVVRASSSLTIYNEFQGEELILVVQSRKVRGADDPDRKRHSTPQCKMVK